MVKKSTSVVATLLVAGGLLVGCASTEPGVEPASDSNQAGDAPRQDEPDLPATADRSSPRGFQFESGFLEFGEFEPYKLGDDIFNPCTEITEQEFAAAGFEQMAYDDGEDALSRGAASCHFGGMGSDRILKGFANGNVSRAIAEERGLVLSGYQSQVIPELYVLPAKSGDQSKCYAQVDTTRGALVAEVGDFFHKKSHHEVCSLAIVMLEEMFRSFGASGTHI